MAGMMPLAFWFPSTVLSERFHARRWSRLGALAVVLSLAASACGAEAGPSPIDAAADVSASPAADATRAADATSDVNGPTDEDAAAPTADGESTAAGPAAAEAPEAAPEQHLFPDLNVLNVADGSTVNLAAELSGSDKATLLWFWAPH